MKVTLFENAKNTAPVKVVEFDTLMAHMLSEPMKKQAINLAELYKSNKDVYDSMKPTLPAFTIGEFSVRNSAGCTQMEPYIGLDVDHVPSEMMREVFDKISSWESCWCVFPSVSGSGFRVIVPVEHDVSNRRVMYEHTAQLFSVYSKIPIDADIPVADRKGAFCINASTKDISRLWFYSGVRVYHQNKDAVVIKVPVSVAAQSTDISNMTLRESDELIVDIIANEAQKRRIDLTVGYSAWVDVGFSIASLGEAGRGPWHIISSVSDQYDYKKCDEKYNELLKNASGRKTIKSLFKTAKDHGIMYTDSNRWKEIKSATREEVSRLQESRKVDDFEEGSDSIAIKLIKHSFRFNEKPKDVEFILKANINGTLFDVGGFGMLGLVTGLEKSRKTTFLRAITSSAMAGGAKKINFQMNLRGKKAIYIDTEQPEYFFWNGQMQAHNMAGLGSAAKDYEAYSMRGFTVEERVAAIDYLIDSNDNLGLVVLDGVLDLVKNFNNEEQSQAIVQKIMQWTDKSGAMFLAVIHVGKSSGMTTGHLGSMLNKKCDFSFEMKNDPDTGYTTVSSKLSRTKPFVSFDFTQDERGFPVLANHNERKHEIYGSYDDPITDEPITYPTPQNIQTTPAKLNDYEDVPF